MATSYPGSLDGLPRPSSSTTMDATGYEGDVVIDNLSDAVEAIEAELGTDPAGAQSTVKARLDGYQRFHTSTLWPKTNTRWWEGGVPLATSLTNQGVTSADRLYYGPIWVPSTVTLSTVGVNVSSGVSGNVRVGIYSATAGSGGLVPGSLVSDVGTATTNSPGNKNISTSQQLTGQSWYFLASVFDVAVELLGFAQATVGAAIDLTVGSGYCSGGWFQSHTYGALPSSPGTLTPRDAGAGGMTGAIVMYMALA